MAQIDMSLGDPGAISNGHTVFERDQVLTHEQLNGVVEYLDDQSRLTRVSLLGVGIACGLAVSLGAGGASVKLSRGVGVTTDGDLVPYPEDLTFDRFRPYGVGAPDYDLAGWATATRFELVAVGVDAPDALALSAFGGGSNGALADASVVLLVESVVTDEDLCTGTGCDNRGAAVTHAVRVLLLPTVPESLRGRFSSAGEVAAALPVVVVNRPSLAAVTTRAGLANAYLTVCGPAHDRLVAAFQSSRDALAGLFSDLPASTLEAWVTKLVAVKAAFPATAEGLQYYYDFLRDLAETWSTLRDRLFDVSGVCVPSAGAFPKHLVLGKLGGVTDVDRTGFYPAPGVGDGRRQFARARFVVSRLDAMISAFGLPAVPEVRVTPSLFEDRDLEERAIPYYYLPTSVPSVRDRWSFDLDRRGMNAFNYSYHAVGNAMGGANDPLNAPAGRFTFFRVEGHVGKNVDEILAALRAINLPFAVLAVRLGPAVSNDNRFPPFYFSDLHRLHALIRKELSEQLKDLTTFTNDVVSTQLSGTADWKERIRGNLSSTTNLQNAINAATLALRSYGEYTAAVESGSLAKELKQIAQASKKFRLVLGDVVKPGPPTSLDIFLSNPHIHWLSWLDALIKDKQDKAAGRLLFSAFRGDHPGLEHFAGVVRGGTLVLAYDSSNKIVADFMLPYRCCEPPSETEPTLSAASTAVPVEVNELLAVVQPVSEQITAEIQTYDTRVVRAQFAAVEKVTDHAIAIVAGNARPAPMPATTTGGGRVTAVTNLNARLRSADPSSSSRNDLLINLAVEYRAALRAFAASPDTPTAADRAALSEARKLIAGNEAAARIVTSALASEVDDGALRERFGALDGQFKPTP